MKKPESLIWRGKKPTTAMRKDIDSLPHLSVNELREKYAEVLGYSTRSRNRQFLIRKLTWAIQSNEWGDISEEARARAHELADFRLLRMRLPSETAATPAKRTLRKRVAFDRDPRLPMPGAIITKEYENRRLDVCVLEKGFEFEGKQYRSLSAIAREVTGTQWNGFAFFGLGGEQ